MQPTKFKSFREININILLTLFHGLYSKYQKLIFST